MNFHISLHSKFGKEVGRGVTLPARGCTRRDPGAHQARQSVKIGHFLNLLNFLYPLLMIECFTIVQWFSWIRRWSSPP